MKPIPIDPQPGQESVWDYPRPAILAPTDKEIEIICNGITLAKTDRAYRVLETSHPPVYYLPASDIQLEYLVSTPHLSRCEWKGTSRYYDVCVGDRSIPRAAWRYIQPTSPFQEIADSYAFYPALMDACYVNGELVTPQPGNFYGGWITTDIVGPFKGEPGTMGW
jgi:uncharacterized protein (DUF427 family)